ncbi:hypothetical protein K2Y00_03240 [Patescibacteria group bacterium]|nr:hypothetical protein [Patescibacteria group bacterium]
MSDDKGQGKNSKALTTQKHGADLDHFVLEKSIFSKVFEKDIRRVYIYKKAERLAKAIHMVSPAFRGSPALRDRIANISVCLVDGAVCTPNQAREVLAKELLALSSILSIARSAGILSPMNTDIIAREAKHLLEEVAGYEDPHLALEETPRLENALRSSGKAKVVKKAAPVVVSSLVSNKGQVKGQVKAAASNGNRREAIISVLRSKGPSFIKDISTVVRDVSEKTIQRELQGLVLEGKVSKTGDRRWTTYRLIASS